MRIRQEFVAFVRKDISKLEKMAINDALPFEGRAWR